MRSSTKVLEQWNRKIHFYLGLYFLCFLWLFALTGLLLNHGQWRVALAANARVESRSERRIDPPAGTTDLERAHDVMRQLGLAGEVDIPPQQAGTFQFSTSRPSDANTVRVNLEQGVASVQHFENSHWARFRILHTFSGSRYNQPASQRDWMVTSVWVFAMDALSVGLIVMILGSYYMWWRLKPKHALGLLSLAAGVAACGWFVLGW
jgi:hypothetical protein